jgi:hypothetical protein
LPFVVVVGGGGGGGGGGAEVKETYCGEIVKYSYQILRVQ